MKLQLEAQQIPSADGLTEVWYTVDVAGAVVYVAALALGASWVVVGSSTKSAALASEDLHAKVLVRFGAKPEPDEVEACSVCGHMRAEHFGLGSECITWGCPCMGFKKP